MYPHVMLAMIGSASIFDYFDNTIELELLFWSHQEFRSLYTITQNKCSVFQLLVTTDSFICSMASTIERYHRHTLAPAESSQLTVDHMQVIIEALLSSLHTI